MAAAAVLLAGCGSAAPAPAAPSAPSVQATSGPATSVPTATPGPSTPGPSTAGPATSVPTGTGRPVELPFPAATPTEAAALQASVDSGHQPWLLDPSDVALAYVAAAHGWSGAEATPVAGGSSGSTTVDVRATDGRELSLTLSQPVRTGPGGIWTVTTDSSR